MNGHGHDEEERRAQGKRAAARAAAELVESGMTVGLGTGSTVAYLLPALRERDLDIRCVTTSPGTENLAREEGLETIDLEVIGRVDLAIDGADQVAPDFWLSKGGGGAHTREKLVAAAADRFVVIADSSKLQDALSSPVPLELLSFGLMGTLSRLGAVTLREDTDPSPDGGVIADWTGTLHDPAEVSQWLSCTTGVVEHGLFPPDMVQAVVIGDGQVATWLEPDDR